MTFRGTEKYPAEAYGAKTTEIGADANALYQSGQSYVVYGGNTDPVENTVSSVHSSRAGCYLPVPRIPVRAASMDGQSGRR